ncbi:MAG: hypothetical protein HC795_18820 [Coleofasciculaceae cyanobacterium RL_1_1]|nr:hypothetical protein [Coleofasciculaceae cyanobacterium RL_1_1]
MTTPLSTQPKTLPSCTLSFFGARTDVAFLEQTIPHIVRMCRYPFTEKVLAIDTAPLSGDKLSRPDIGTLEDVRAIGDRLIAQGVIDRAVDMEYDIDYQRQVYQKHFGTANLRPTHNYKGYPILGSIFQIEAASSDYLLHFDSDVLLHEAPDFSWIEAAIKLLEENPYAMAARPMAGPPGLVTDAPQSFSKHKFSGGRCYLINRKRFDKILPMPITWFNKGFKFKAINYLPNPIKTPLCYQFKKGKLQSWEVMVTAAIANTPYFRMDLAAPKAWTLHPNDHGPQFLKALPDLLKRIEAGSYPPAQAGQYDMVLEEWLKGYSS